MGLPIVKTDCGERGIRTLEEREPLTVFKTAAFNHSAISPSIFVCVHDTTRFTGKSTTLACYNTKHE